MAYFGLNPGAPTEPGGLVVAEGGGKEGGREGGREEGREGGREGGKKGTSPLSRENWW